MRPASKENYKALTNDEDRRSYVCQVVLDPSIAKTNGFNRDFAFDETTSRARETWWTREQIGGPKGLNNMAHADVLINSGSLESRPHEAKALADLGVLQYAFTQSMIDKATGHRHEAGTEAEAELKADEYIEAKSHITESFGTPCSVKRKSSGKRLVEETPEEKRLKTSNAARSTALRQAGKDRAP